MTDSSESSEYSKFMKSYEPKRPDAMTKSQLLKAIQLRKQGLDNLVKSGDPSKMDHAELIKFIRHIDDSLENIMRSYPKIRYDELRSFAPAKNLKKSKTPKKSKKPKKRRSSRRSSRR
tara:strand:+ start:70 stop:423 length:354 start_codon:yes stop_codon:yes gene_type:complete